MTTTEPALIDLTASTKVLIACAAIAEHLALKPGYRETCQAAAVTITTELRNRADSGDLRSRDWFAAPKPQLTASTIAWVDKLML